jgi:8-oxo-dGTP pyrophosphatase MutT (NUDIX family)
MQWKPNVTVAAIVERVGKFLVVEENADGAIVINQPAGHLEQGESLEQAIRREVREETGLDFTPQALVGVYLYRNPRADIVYLRFCFCGSCAGAPAAARLDHGIIRPLWLTRAELEGRHEQLRSEMVLKCIDDYLAGRRYPLELINHCLPA